jgi:hypothetical protein
VIVPPRLTVNTVPAGAAAPPIQKASIDRTPCGVDDPLPGKSRSNDTALPDPQHQD